MFLVFTHMVSGYDFFGLGAVKMKATRGFGAELLVFQAAVFLRFRLVEHVSVGASRPL